MNDADASVGTLSVQDLNAKIERLETRLTYQDDTIETLNQTITKQWREIDRLTRQMALLGDRIEEARSNTEAPANEPPPHY